MALYVTQNGKVRRAEDVELANKIIDLKNKKDHWAVIDELVKAWVKRSPEEVQAIKINISDAKEVAIDKKFGSTKRGKDFDRRLTLLFPNSLMLLIRTQYKATELPFDSAFYREFGKRYPGFRIAEKT